MPVRDRTRLLDRLKHESVPVDWDLDRLMWAFFSGRQATVVELGACARPLARLRSGELWSGRLSFPCIRLRSKSAGHVDRSPRETLQHYELKESVWSWLSLTVCEELFTEVIDGDGESAWDCSARMGPDVIRVECGTTPPWRMDGLGEKFAAFMVVPFRRYGQTECQGYLFGKA